MFKNSKISFKLLLCGLYLFVSISHSDSRLATSTSVLLAKSETPKPSCQLTLGWDLVKPYQYFDNADRVVGLQMDLIRAIMVELGCELSLYKNDWNALLDKLNKGEIDFMADMTITNERRLIGYFSDPYRNETFSLYVRKSERHKYEQNSIEELVKKGFRLGLTNGFIYGKDIESLKNHPDYKSLLTVSDRNYQNYNLLLQDRIDGLLEDSLVAGYTLRDMQVSHLIEGIPSEVHGGEISFMFSKKTVSPALVKAFNQALTKVKQSDVYNKSWLQLAHPNNYLYK